MVPATLATLLTGISLVTAAPQVLRRQSNCTLPVSAGQAQFSFPTEDGFPNVTPGSEAPRAIQIAAHGTLPNGPLPSTLAGSSNVILSLIAANELFEVAFFTALVHNITNNLPGFEVGTAAQRTTALDNLNAVAAQEKLHAIGANAILAGAGFPAIEPCKYVFPSATYQQAIRFASTLTDLVLGTLQDAAAGFVENGDDALIPLLTSIIAQEGEQDGGYRKELGLIPSQLPFLTRSKAVFAWSALNQLVVVPGSCPNADLIAIPVLGALAVEPAAPTPNDQTLTFSFKKGDTDLNDVSIAYINQQNLPVVVQPSNVQISDDMAMVTANFPYSATLMNGLTIAAVTTKATSFASADEVAAAALFGPGLIEIA